MSEKILPIPCTKVEERTVKDWFREINEEIDELKAEITEHFMFDFEISKAFSGEDYETKWDAEDIAEKATDAITAITSMLEAMGIDECMRQEAQRKINEKNRERGRF
jgi:hypothetical protein